ncbi:MAG: hypothetical protein IJ335_12240 [Lachnospiraceae bacterium]|nr:hypothetical protein [Lachnospiraceae bacterium]
MKWEYNRSICYIVTVFLLIIGMCQGRIQADFCFEWDKNGQVVDFFDSTMDDVSSAELNSGDYMRFQELSMNTKAISAEGKRILARFFVQLLQAVVFLSCFSIFQRTEAIWGLGEGTSTHIIVRYLHQKDGKK